MRRLHDNKIIYIFALVQACRLDLKQINMFYTIFSRMNLVEYTRSFAKKVRTKRSAPLIRGRLSASVIRNIYDDALEAKSELGHAMNQSDIRYAIPMIQASSNLMDNIASLCEH